MVTRFPQHAALEMLLEQKQFEACRMVAEKMIEELMAPPRVEGEQSAAIAANRWQERDLELAHLHLVLSKCLFELHEYEAAAIKADMAGLLAKKAADVQFHAEALHLAGACYGQAGNYRGAAQHFTECLLHAEGPLRAKAFYNRGHAYERQGAFSFAVPDYEEAVRLVRGQDDGLEKRAWINLAWNLILLQEFQRAEEVLNHLCHQPGADDDSLVQAQILHDRIHMTYLQGAGKEALRLALGALRQHAQAYPHVRAYIALTIMSLATDHDLSEEACVVGILAKRLAGKARRQDIDDQANRRLQDLEAAAGTDTLVQSLAKTKQVLPGMIGGRKASRRGPKIGGVS